MPSLQHEIRNDVDERGFVGAVRPSLPVPRMRGRLEQKKRPMCCRKRGRSAAAAGGHAVLHLRQNTSNNRIIRDVHIKIW